MKKPNLAAACLLVLLAPLACKNDHAAKPDGPGADASAASGEDPNAKKRITKDDCTKWAEHAVSVIITDLKNASKGCPEAQRDQFTFRVDGQRASMRLAAIELCNKHLDETYLAKDGSCYLGAKSAVELLGCKLAPMTSPGDDDVGAVLENMRKQCSGGGGLPTATK